MATIENGAQHMHTHYSELHLTLMKTEQPVSITLQTQVSLTTHTFDICYLIFLFLFVIFKKSFLGHNRDNRMRCEHTFFGCCFKQEEHQHVHQDLQAA